MTMHLVHSSCWSILIEQTAASEVTGNTYRKVASSQLSPLLAHPKIFRLIMKLFIFFWDILLITENHGLLNIKLAPAQKRKM